MNASEQSPDPHLEALLSGLAPRKSLDSAEVLYAAGRAAAAAELAASGALRLRRWQAAAAVSTMLAASLAAVLAWPANDISPSSPTPALAKTSSGATTAVAAVDLPDADVEYDVSRWRHALRATDARVLQAGMTPLELRQVLLRDELSAGGVGRPAYRPVEPFTPRSFDRAIDVSELHERSPT
ncbi:MAG: hypothetical protein KDA44_03550 [Planctomycetales bacterium]|nr:hypothetical protein [Planctomycetales bacterium]